MLTRLNAKLAGRAAANGVAIGNKLNRLLPVECSEMLATIIHP